MSPNTIALKEANEARAVGGKAAALGRLIRAGFNVPSGFVITARSKNQMTDMLKREIYAGFDELKAKAVAVRSSAAAEDSHQASWAGQFETFLNTDRHNLIENISKCFSSANSRRAKAYAQEKSITSGPVAVIIQVMIPSQSAGVAFSMHPVTNDQNLIVIESVNGLGEKLVAGRSPPDTYMVDKQSEEIVKKHLVGQKPILTKPKIKEVIKATKRIEALFGFPVDIEWAYYEDKLFILQSRPITALV